jgi:general secretion pathway protein M
MMLNRSLQSTLAVVLLFLAIAVLGAAAAAPYIQLARIDSEFAAQEAELTKLRRNHADEASLRAENENLISSGQSATLLLEGETIGIAGATLQRLIADLVVAHNGTASSLQVLPPATEDDLVRISLSLSLSVGIDGLQGFLHALETGQPLIFIDDIRVRSGQSEFSVPDPHLLGPLDVTLQVSAFAPKKEQTQ